MLNAGTTSLTVRSTRTPPMSLKHLRSGLAESDSLRVDSTSLEMGDLKVGRDSRGDRLVFLCLEIFRCPS